MTVRQRSELAKILGSGSNVRAIWATSNTVGELMVQVTSKEGGTQTVYIPSSRSRPQPVNLLAYATPTEWKKSVSLLSAVRQGHLSVSVETE